MSLISISHGGCLSLLLPSFSIMPSNSSPLSPQSDSSSDEELFRPTFEAHGKKIAKKKPSASKSSKVASKTSDSSLKVDKESLLASAKRKTTAKSLPAGISSSNELVWYLHTNNEGESEDSTYIPCRICDANEARFIQLDPNSWDRKEVSLVQALVDDHPFTGKRDRILANKTSLLPYNGKQDTHTNSPTDSWCRTLWKRYSHYRKQQARESYTTCSDQDLQVTWFYLQRILQHAQQRQYDVEQADELSSQEDGEAIHPPTKQQQAQQPHHDDDTSSQDSSSSIASDDLEVPYAENLCSQPDNYLDIHMFDDDKQAEPLRPGDVIEYTLPIYRAGDKRGVRQSKVLSTDPNRMPILVLENGDVLPSDTSVKRIFVLEHGQVYPHPHGYFRAIERFVIEKRGDATVQHGLKQEGRRMDKIIDKHLAKFEQQAKQNGFAPMDIFHKRKKQKRRNGGGGGEPSGGGGDDAAGTIESNSKQRRRPSTTAKETTKSITGDYSDDSDGSVDMQVKKPRGGQSSKLQQHDSDSSSSSSSSMDVQVQSTKQQQQGRTKNIRSFYGKSSSDSDSSDSDASHQSIVDPDKLETRRLLAKIKQHGTKAFDPSDSSESDNGGAAIKRNGGGKQVTKRSSRGSGGRTKQVARKVNGKRPASKKSSDKVPVSKKPSFTKVVKKKKSTASKTVSKPSTTGARRKSNKKVPAEPVLASIIKPGEWMSTRRDTHESLGIESDVTSLASLPSRGRSSASVTKSSGDKTTSGSSILSQGAAGNPYSLDDDAPVVVDAVAVQDRKQPKRKIQQRLRQVSAYHADSESSDQDAPSPPRNKSRRRPVANKKDDNDGSSSDLSVGGPSLSNHHSRRHSPKSITRSSSRSPPQPPKEGPVMVDLLNSPPRKEKPKRASYGSRGKSRVELGQSSIKKKRNKASAHENSLSFHSSSSDESSVDMDKYRRSDKRNDDNSSGRNERTTLGDSHSGNTESVTAKPRPATGKRKSSVLDLTGSDGPDSSDDENPAPPRKRGTKRRIIWASAGRTTKSKSNSTSTKQNGVAMKPKDASTTAANGTTSSFKLSLTKGNVRKNPPASASKQRSLLSSAEGTLAGGERIYETQDSSDSNTESARKRRTDDLGDWGGYRGDSPSPEANKNDMRFLGEQRPVATFRLGSTSTNNSNTSRTRTPGNPFARNEGDDELVDSSSDDSDLDSSQQSDPKKRLFRSSQWKSGASHSSFASSTRVQVGNKRQRNHY